MVQEVIKMVENIPLHAERSSRWDLPSGTYHFNPDATYDGKKVGILLFHCPNGTKENNHIANLPHEIKADGTVHPSIVCPHKGCSYHVMGKLMGWQWGHRPDQKVKK
jgi:hypothetical protein